MVFVTLSLGAGGGDPKTGAAVIRGPMVSNIVTQLCSFTLWGAFHFFSHSILRHEAIIVRNPPVQKTGDILLPIAICSDFRCIVFFFLFGNHPVTLDYVP